MIYIHWAGLLIYAIVIVGTMITVLMDNRQPAKTMAWMLVLTFLPIAGIILYFFFGQNTRKEKFISQKSMNQLTKRSMLEFAEQKGLVVPPECETLVKLFASQNWALPFKNNDIEIFTDGYGFFGSLLRHIGCAHHHIHIDTYIFNDDALGYLIADALIDSARRGVEVRVIYDDVGCWSVKGAFFERMRNAGIDVHAFMPVKFPAFTGKVNYRNHRKLCVIDGKVGFIGGMNIATRYVRGRNGQAWRDTHLRITGSGVYAIQRAFLVDWFFVDRTLISNRLYYPEPDSRLSNNCIIQIVTGSPVSPLPDIMHGYVRILTEARHYVYMETPYFLPTETVLFAMRTAVLAGVDVRLIIPMRTDTRIAEWAGRSFVQEAAEVGVKVYLYKSGFNHSKLLVCDDRLCTCGSTNIDFRSFENNFEANAFIYDRNMTLRMKQIFMKDIEDSVLYEETVGNTVSGNKLTRYIKPFFMHLWESLIRLFAPLL